MKKTALITGASGGIGSAAAKALALKGYDVILHYNKNRSEAERLLFMLKNEGCTGRILRADLSRPEEIEYLSKASGCPDVLVNNCGISLSGLFTEAADDDIIRIINTNLVSAMLLSKALLPAMIKRKSGRIINISSIWGITGAACEVAYSTAKAGLIGFTKALAKEVGPSGISVNCVAPGVIRTRMLYEYSEEALKELKNSTPLGRLGEPYDIAAAICFLASDGADFITGQVISPNGGFVI